MSRRSILHDPPSLIHEMDHRNRVDETLPDDFQHFQIQRGSGSNRGFQQLPIFDAKTNKPILKPQTTTPQVKRAPVKPTLRYHEQPVDSAPYPPSLFDIDTQRISRSSNAHRRDKHDVPPKRRERNVSAQRANAKQSHARERFRSAERAENVFKNNNNNTAVRKQSRNHQGYLSQQRHGDHENSPQFLTNNDSGKHKVEIPTSEDVFNFMVKNMSGKGTPEDIRKKSKLFSTEVDVSEWFRKNKSRFTLIEKNEEISCIFVYNKKTTFCIDYGRKNLCRRTDCQRYHICRKLCAGKCIHGRSCTFSHDCFDEHNKKISDDLGFSNTFSNDEICIILRLSFPHVCSTWSFKGTCRDSNCVDLHICPGYVLRKCKNGPTCKNIHDKNTDHNRAILNAFEMTEMKHEVFKWRVFLVHNPAWIRNEQTAPGTTDTHGSRMSSSVSEAADDAGETVICVDHILGECRNKPCKFIHSKSRLPYVWQINVFDEWISLKESEEIEEKFADNADRSAKIQTTYNGMNFSIMVMFEPVIKAFVIIQSFGEDAVKTKARRLATRSYIDPVSSSNESKNGDTGKFFTQWRWYWLDDYKQWNLFQPDAFQYTLEVKYLVKQHAYSFSRDNFSYTISFDELYQRNFVTNKLRLIRRRPVFVSSHDVAKKECPSKLDVVTLIRTPLPESWMPWDLSRPYELVDITSIQSAEVNEVIDLFFKTIDYKKKKIRAIYRVQNHKLWGLFCNEEITLQAKAGRVGYTNGVNKQFLFHGTDDERAVDGICVNNFDIRVSGKIGTHYGDGAYFARDAKYSDCYTKGPVRYMFVVNVLVGQHAQGDKSYRRPPELPRSRELYDSCVNDIADPSIFVVFDKNQYYPQYLIKYRDKVQEDTAL